MGYVWSVGFLEVTLTKLPPNYFYWYGRDKREKWEDLLEMLKKLPVPKAV